MKKPSKFMFIKRLDRGMIWLGPISVLAFVVVLTVMYGWVGDMAPPGEAPERPEASLANQNQMLVPAPVLGQPTQAGGQPAVQQAATQFPAGIGSGQNGQVQLINDPTFSAGIGSGHNGQIQLINQAVQGPYMGLDLRLVPETVAAALKIAPETGLYVNTVVASSPAETAGLQSGDVVMSYDNQKAVSQEQMAVFLKTKKAGDVIKLVVNRDGKTRSFHVKLQNAPVNLLQAAAAAPVPNWMGADIQDIDAIMKAQFNLPDKNGVIVSHVTAPSPALTAGLMPGDVIRRFGGTTIRNVKQLQSLILGAQPGSQIQLTLFRGGQYLTRPVVLGQQSPVAPKIPFLGPADVTVEGAWIGMDLAELTASDVSSLGLAAGTQGVRVSDVEGPPASMAGFQTGDVITAVNSVSTPDLKRFADATRKQAGAVVDVIRGGKHIFISIPPPGFTKQGTQIKSGLNNTFKQVAATRPVDGYLGILTDRPDMNAAVAPGLSNAPSLIIVDVASDSYAVSNPVDQGTIASQVRQYNIRALICGSIPGTVAQELGAGGVVVYSGVVGTALDAIDLYRSNRLVAMQ